MAAEGIARRSIFSSWIKINHQKTLKTVRHCRQSRRWRVSEELTITAGMLGRLAEKLWDKNVFSVKVRKWVGGGRSDQTGFAVN